MTTTSRMYEQVFDVLVELGLEPSAITAGAVLRADLDVDSAELVEIVTTLAPGRADGKALKSVVTVADLVAFLEDLT